MFETNPAYSEFYNPRLVAIYNTVNPVDSYKAFYLALAKNLSATMVIDLGCGSGLLTCELASQGHRMIGVEPSDLMLELARQSPYGEQVEWIEGGADQLTEGQADLVIMTGHVAQFYLDDESWTSALQAIDRALLPGGHLAFESRNPAVYPWFDGESKGHLDWLSTLSRQKVNDPVAGEVEWWADVIEARGGRLRYDIHYLFRRSGEELISHDELRFRSREEITQTLMDAGFSIESVFGDWDGSPASTESHEMIFVARRLR